MNFLNLKSFFNLKIHTLNKFEIGLVYTAYIAIVCILSIVYCYLNVIKFNIADINNNIIIGNLQFSYADLVNNLVNKWEFYSNFYGTKFFLGRLPTLPFVITLAIKISTNIYFIFLFKSFIFFTIYFFILIITIKSLDKNLFLLFILLIFSFVIPYNIHVGLSIFFADSIIYLILPCLYLITLSKHHLKYYLLSFLLITLYLTKTSVAFIVLFYPFLILFLEEDHFNKKLIPLYAMIIVVLSWGIFGLSKTGRFPIFKSTITLNSQALFYINCNPQFIKNYPHKSVDILLPKIIDYSNYKNEWEVFDDFNKKIKSTECKGNSFLQDLPKKIKFIFFNVHKDNVNPDKNGNFNNPLIFSYIINKIFFNLAFFISLFTIIFNFKAIIKLNDFNRFRVDIYYLSIISLNLLPHLVAWSTSKHLVAIHFLSIIYIFFKFENIFFNKSN